MEEVHLTEHKRPNVTERKPPGRATLSPDEKLLVGPVAAAGMLSISCRALDYLVANKQLLVRRIGTRVLIPLSELQRFSRSDHPERLGRVRRPAAQQSGVHKIFLSLLNPNSHQNSHQTKTKKATSRVAPANYSFLWCLWLLR